MIGLKRGTVSLCAHEKEWETEAERTISRLKAILGDVILDIQHVGSTSIPAIQAKPIIDIAVAVDHFDSVLAFEKELNSAGFYYRPKSDLGEQLLFASGSYYDGTGDLQTHFIHVVHTPPTQRRMKRSKSPSPGRRPLIAGGRSTQRGSAILSRASCEKRSFSPISEKPSPLK